MPFARTRPTQLGGSLSRATTVSSRTSGEARPCRRAVTTPPWSRSAKREQDQATGASCQAVPAEWAESVRVYPSGQPTDRDIGSQTGHDRPEQHLRSDAVAERTEQVGELEHARRENHRRGQQEREAQGVLAAYPCPHACCCGDAGA